MLNQVIIVGRLVKDLDLKEINDKKVGNITLAVSRGYKNANGEYDTDFIDCVLWNGVAENTAEYCKKGDIIGVKGRIETYQDKDNKKVTQIIADRVTFLSSKKED